MPAPGVPVQQVPLSSDFASSSSSGSGYSSEDYRVGKGLSVPHRARLTDPTRLRVRPDLYTVSFAVREQRESSHAAQDAARASSERVIAQLLKALGPVATTNVKGFTLTRVTQEAKPIGVMAVVDGTLEVRLAEGQDFWVRSRLFTTLIETTQAIAEAAGSSPNSLHAVSFEPPRAEVLDPEAYRPELLKRWVARVRDFTSAAEASAAPLYVRDCAPPGAVGQSTSSFDEVLLELAITCRIDTRTSVGVTPRE
ncbi:MAG TPA: SIMPL domain-containing protein [Polyangiaceae bacterium]|nr:SIMPL domain-containing protein [Polyangiaceae bacterium]